MNTIYIAGNEFLDTDALPVLILPQLQTNCPDLHFVRLDPTENPDDTDATMTIIDTVIGIDTLTVFTDLQAFVRSPRNTVHDYDLYLDLSLQQKTGNLKQVTIIGIPEKMQPDTAVSEITDYFQRTFKK